MIARKLGHLPADSHRPLIAAYLDAAFGVGIETARRFVAQLEFEDGECRCLDVAFEHEVVVQIGARHALWVPTLGHNPTIPAAINNWDIQYDPFGYAVREEWTDSELRQEDILLLSHSCGRLWLDVGWYGSVFVVLVVIDDNWDEPVRRVETPEPRQLNGIVNSLLEAFENPVDLLNS